MRLKIFVLVLFGLFLAGCADEPPVPNGNDPSRYTLASDVLWASPDGFDLTMDIYSPTAKSDAFPVIVMFHGGGWLINDKSIMDQASQYLATNSNYVVCNVNYRLLGDNDNTVTMDQIVNDAFGAVLWVKDNIGEYKGDKDAVVVTGDSAGGHLAAMVVNSGQQLSSQAFSAKSPKFSPSYMPRGVTPEQVAQSDLLAVQAAMLSYGAFDIHQSALAGFEEIGNPFWMFSGSWARGIMGEEYSVLEQPELYKAVSPIHNVEHASQRQYPPQLLTVGSDDPVTTPDSVRAYAKKLRLQGQRADFWEYEGRSHAFLDSGSNRLLGVSFAEHAPAALDVMINFLDSVFYDAEEV